MKVYFLGTNGWYDSNTGNTTCVLVEAEKEYVILDAGNGFHKIDEYITRPKPVRLFISHYHLDHVIGLHALNKFRFEQGIDIYGPRGLRRLFKDVINVPYTISSRKLKTLIRLHEIKRPVDMPPWIISKPLRHSTVCYGYRLNLDNKTLAYCVDTDLCDNLYRLADRTDLLITECSYKNSEVDDKWPHLTPNKAANAAKMSNTGRLALIHFDPSRYSNMRDRERAAGEARKIFKPVVAGRDNLGIKV